MASGSKWKVWLNQRTARNQNWTENETATLIGVWFKYLDILKLHRRTGKIYEKMACEFAQCGFKRSAGELQKKVSNLTQEYRKERKKAMNGQGPSKWKFYSSVEDIVQKLNSCRHIETAPSSQNSESDGESPEDIKFMAVYLMNEQEQSMSEEDREEPPSPVIVSVESQAISQAEPACQDSPRKKVLQDLKTEMHRALEESLDLHRQQITMQQRQVVLQEDMLKIMARFIDNCP